MSYPETGHAACFQIEDGSFWFAHRNACIVAALRRAHVTGPLVDVGGGNGAVSAALERAGIATVLVEPGPVGAQNARARGLRQVVCSTLEAAGFAPHSFAAAGLFDVAEHVADDAALLRELHRTLRADGALCITVPAHRALWSAEDDLAGHVRRYTLGGLRAALAAAGFRVAYATYFFAPLVPPIFLVRSLPYRLRPRPTAAAAGAQTAAAQHLPSPLLRRAIDALLAPEVRLIGAGRAIPVGTSCLAIARPVPG